jgi:hypothetical protein
MIPHCSTGHTDATTPKRIPMALSGNAALAMFFDIESGFETEHDHWHTHEHFGERLGIPGFLRAARWNALDGGPAYFMMYEVAEVATLTSAPYLERLDNPSPWTQGVMPYYRNMVRGLTRVVGSAGAGLAGFAMVARISPEEEHGAALDDWLTGTMLPQLAMQPGLSGAHLLAAAAQAPMTQEQAIRGRDATVDRVLVVVGYDETAVRGLAGDALGEAALAAHGARHGRIAHPYRLAATATKAELHGRASA